MADPHAWRDRAACNDVNPELFYPPTEGQKPSSPHAAQIRAAKNICCACPVRRQCYADAMATDPLHDWGIRAGLTARERRELRKRAAA